MPDARLSPADLVVVAVYVAGVALLGVWFSRRSAGLKSYFVGDRDVGWFLVLASIVATETSAVTFLSVPGTAFGAGGDFRFLQLALGYAVGRVLVAWLLVPLYFRGELYSAYQVLERKFGRGVQRVASGLFLLTRTVADGLRLYLTALVMQYVGWGVEGAVVAVGVVTILYTYLGGIKAVLWTDLIQFAVQLAGAALAFVFLVQLLPGGWGEYVAVGDAAAKFRWFDGDFHADVPLNIWAGLIGGAALSMATHGADQLMVQRYLCAKSLTQARVAVVLSGVVVVAQFALFLAIGVGLFAAVQAGVFVAGDARNDAVFGLFIVTKLPIGVVGLLVAALLAAAMSTLSSSLNSSANALVTDFYQPLRPGRPERHYVRVSKLATAGWGVAQIAVALVAHASGGGRSVIDSVMTVAGFTTGLVLGLFVLGMLPRAVKPGAAMAGLVAGFAAVTGVWVPSLFGRTILAWPWFALLGAAVTVAAALLLDRLSRRHAAG